MLPLSVLLLIEKALNQYIALDPLAKEKQMALNGKVLGLSIMGSSIDLYFLFNQDHIYLQRTCLGQPDLFIQSPPFALLQLFQTDHPQGMLHQSNITITGDLMLAQKFKSFFQSIQIPWEYYLSLLTGEIFAEQSSQFIKKSLGRLKNFSSQLTNNLSEYIQEEAYITPHHHAIELLCDDVDILRNDVDLLEARVAKIRELL